MPLSRLVLILICAIAGAALTLALAAGIAAAWRMPALGLAMAVPVTLIAWVFGRVLVQRLRDPVDRHYDHFDR